MRAHASMHGLFDDLVHEHVALEYGFAQQQYNLYDNIHPLLINFC